MARGFKEKVRVIEVKPVDDNDHILTYDESNDNSSPDRRGKFHHSKILDIVDKNNFAEKDGELANEDDANNVEKVLTDIKSTEDLKIKLVNELDVQSTTNSGQSNVLALGDHIDVEKEEKSKKNEKKRKKKKEKKKKKKKDKAKGIAEPNATEDIPKPEAQEDTKPAEEVNEIEAAPDAKSPVSMERKLPCIFGFISSWIAKRKEKRRAKKRKAIEDRKSVTPVEELVEYEHRRAKGGVAFTLEVDNRPMKLPVLPPIKQRTGNVIHGTDEKLEKAEIKRSEELKKKKRSSKDYEIKRAECKERKEESEFYFKQKAELTVNAKQCVAKKNRTKLQEDRRCSTPMLRAPSTLPPLRIIRVKPFADVEQSRTRSVGTQYEDPDDEIFNF